MVKTKFMIYGITYSDPRMSISAEKCCESMLRNGIDSAHSRVPKTIDAFFRENNLETLLNERGCGYWLWKPYSINDYIHSLQDGDILIYSDAGVEFVNNVSYIIDRMDENIFLFTNTHPNHHWTKQYTLDQMAAGWEKIYGPDTPWPQVQASVIFFKVCQETRDFVKRWLLWCQMPGIINDDRGDEYPFFQDHRHDQSVLSILATKAGYKLHWWPTAYAEHIRVEGDTYPVIFNHHRKRNNEW